MHTESFFPVSYTHIATLPIRGVPKPRMTRSDKWKERAPVMQYRSFCSRLRAIMKFNDIDLDINQPYALIFRMATSKQERWGSRHNIRPDKDNLEKAILDALHKQDKEAWNGLVIKVWDKEDAIEIWQGSLPAPNN